MSHALEVEMEDVRVSRRQRLLLHVPYLRVNRGERWSVVGPNGAGKSTLLKVMATWLKPDPGGQVLLDGRPVHYGGAGLRDRRRIATVFQDGALLSGSVRENVELPLRLRGVGAEERRRRAETWLERVGIVRLASHDVRTLSGGERQRVALVRAMIAEPDLLLLDEPLTSLDPPTRVELLLLLSEVIGDSGVTSIAITHDFTEMPALGDQALCLIDGNISQVGSPQELLDHPRTLSTARFVGVENLLPVQLRPHPQGSEVLLDGNPFVVAGDFATNLGRDGNAYVGMRAEHILVAPVGEGRASMSTAGTRSDGHPEVQSRESPNYLRWLGTVKAVVPWGDRWRVDVDSFTTLHASMPRAAAAPLPGERVSLSVPTDAVRLLSA